MDELLIVSDDRTSHNHRHGGRVMTDNMACVVEESKIRAETADPDEIRLGICDRPCNLGVNHVERRGIPRRVVGIASEHLVTSGLQARRDIGKPTCKVAGGQERRVLSRIAVRWWDQQHFHCAPPTIEKAPSRVVSTRASKQSLCTDGWAVTPSCRACLHRRGP